MKSEKKTKQTFQIVSISQIILHLIAYGITFIKLMLVDGGGYLGIGTVVFIGISIVSFLLLIISVLLAKFSSRLSTTKMALGYGVHGVVLAWSIFIIYVSFFM